MAGTMVTDRFDYLTRAVSLLLSRRTMAGALGLGTLGLPGLAEPKKKRKNKNKKLKKNQFGCVDVGEKCRGNDANCCSGICEGKKPKKGKKDKSTCVAHDESTCQPGQTLEECGGAADVACTTTTGDDGVCVTTTGHAGYCFNQGNCFPCSRDTDCEVVCGAGAACVVCAAACEVETGGVTACVGPSEESCEFPE